MSSKFQTGDLVQIKKSWKLCSKRYPGVYKIKWINNKNEAALQLSDDDYVSLPVQWLKLAYES